MGRGEPLIGVSCCRREFDCEFDFDGANGEVVRLGMGTLLRKATGGLPFQRVEVEPPVIRSSDCRSTNGRYAGVA